MVIFRIVTLITALVIFGEALALSIGMVLVNRAKNSWLTVRNAIFLILDLFIGAALIYLALSAHAPVSQPLFGGLSLMAFLSHTYRDIEYWRGIPRPFCFNQPLFIVNNFKLLGLLGIMPWSLFL